MCPPGPSSFTCSFLPMLHLSPHFTLLTSNFLCTLLLGGSFTLCVRSWDFRSALRLHHGFLHIALLHPPSAVLCSSSHSAGPLFSTSSHLLCPLLHLLVITPPPPSYLLSFPSAFSLCFLISSLVHHWAQHSTLSLFLPSLKLSNLHFLLPPLPRSFRQGEELHFKQCMIGGEVATIHSFLLEKNTFTHSQTFSHHDQTPHCTLHFL